MVSDEEKKAVEWFREDLAEEKENCGKYNDYKKQVIKRNEKILNLIEKQSKEIEELKKEYERVRAGRNWLSEHISAQIATPELFDRLVEENYISKDKIKAKIEIRKEEKEDCKDSIEEKYLLREIYVLQSLLEKE